MQAHGPLPGTGVGQGEAATRPAFEVLVAGFVLVVDRLVAVWDVRRYYAYPCVIGELGGGEGEINLLAGLE